MSIPLRSPQDEYRARLERWQAALTASERRSRQLGNARLATGLAAVAIAAVAIGAGWISPWWLIAPLLVFIVLAVAHDRVDKLREAALRGSAYYQRALSRVEHQWIGKGHSGEAFRDPKHLYADDLDVLGAGSLFELLSTSRTATGERVLAGWLLAPSELATARERQEAVAELRGRLDLREEIALMGEDMRAAIDDRSMRKWGELPPVRFFPFARWLALALACAAILSFVLFLTQVLTARPLLVVLLLELIVGMALRSGVQTVLASVSTPAQELKLLGLLLARLEKETFSATHLQRITHALDTQGRTASAEIRRLERLVDYLDSARNQFFRVIAHLTPAIGATMRQMSLATAP